MAIYSDGFVYIWSHRNTGKFYIGSHRGTPDDGYIASGIAIQRAIKRHGIESFDRTIVYQGPDFRKKETDLIEATGACNSKWSYNLSHITEASTHHGPETRAKISASKRGISTGPFTEERKRNLSKAHTGRPVSNETKAKLRASNLGQKRSPETIAKAAAARWKRPQ